MLLEIRRKLATSVRFVSPFAAGGACEEIQAELFDLVHIVTALLRAFVQSSRARSAYGNAVRVVVKKTAAQRNTNTAAAPVHSQKPRCQNTECRSMLRTGIAQDGFNRVSSNKDSLKKIPARGNSVTKDHVQNKRAPKRLRARILHAHQQAVNMPIAMKPAAERARNSCSRRIPNTSCRCCGTTKHVQSSAITPAAKASPVTRAARGEACPGAGPWRRCCRQRWRKRAAGSRRRSPLWGQRATASCCAAIATMSRGDDLRGNDSISGVLCRHHTRSANTV